MAVHRVVTLAFRDPGQCRVAYADALRLPGLRQVAVLERATDGTLDVPLGENTEVGEATVGAGAVGGLLGLAAGPLGALLGATAGAALGSTLEAQREGEEYAAMILLSADVEDGTSLLVLDLKEAAEGPVDELAARYGTAARREDAKDFAARARTAWKNA
ncbi:hypothetical protein ACIG3E_37165 [Streptomyces sp. NPDC053474]|uniref:hypothetical protein n=1 Tax=Streptomyces sp. NPDC053474 TaxID=3365704 RepID=UPI0037D8669A